MTTHSPIVIDEALRRGARIFRLDTQSSPQDSRNALTRIDTDEVRFLLAELGWRPAHLLQANSVVWVEGESDAIYVSRWIELWSFGALRSGSDFVCVHYGGNPRSLLSAATGDIHRINPHAIFVCDSDTSEGSDPLSKAKQDMIDRVNHAGGYAFATDGREIENYIPARLLATIFGRTFEEVDLDRGDLPRTLGFEKRKVAVAKQVATLLTRADIDADPRLREHLQTVCEHITKWRRLAPRS